MRSRALEDATQRFSAASLAWTRWRAVLAAKGGGGSSGLSMGPPPAEVEFRPVGGDRDRLWRFVVNLFIFGELI